jgi:hypothetical protein
MFDFVLALVRILLEIPHVGLSTKTSDEALCIDVDEIEKKYRQLGESDKQWFEDCWQEFRAIVMRQNEAHKRASLLSRKLVGRIGVELAGIELAGAELAEQARAQGELVTDSMDGLRDEICELVAELPRERLADALAYVRALSGSGKVVRGGGHNPEGGWSDPR